MLYGVSLSKDWFEIDGDDYDDEALMDSTPLRARIKIDDLRSGSVGYYGIVEDED